MQNDVLVVYNCKGDTLRQLDLRSSCDLGLENAFIGLGFCERVRVG
jgi:hypothetical protein